MNLFWLFLCLALIPALYFGFVFLRLVVLTTIFQYKRNQLYKKNPKLKKIPALPFNYGIGQFIPYMDRKNVFNYFKDLSQNNPDPLLIYYFLFLEGIFVRDPYVLKDVFVTKSKNFKKSDSIVDIFHALLGNGLVASSGAEWKFHRTLISPVFAPQNVSKLFEIMTNETNNYIGKSWKKVNKGESLNIKNFTSELSKLTLRIIAASAFGTEDEKFFDGMSALWEHIIEDFGFISMMIALFGFYYQYIPLPSNLRFLKNKSKMNEMVKQLIAKRRIGNKKSTGKELLALMMDAEDENGKKISDQGLIDESLTFLFAGHDTTSGLLSFMFWKLAEHQEIQQKVYDEIIQVLGDKKQLEFNDIEKLTYLTQVMNETLRMYPPAVSVSKEAEIDTEIEGYPLPAYSYLEVDIVGLHYNPKIWKNPETFDPDRWSPERIKEIPLLRFSWIPFSAGSRNCVGKLFATTEAPLLCSMILQTYHVELMDKNDVVSVDATFVLKADNLNLKLTRRN